MRPAAALLALLAVAPACSVGAGSAYVGQWRAHERVDVEVCVEDASGRCVEERQIVSQVPARRFWGFSMGMVVGAASTATEGDGDLRLRTGFATEYLRGRGNLAAGLRADMLVDFGDDMVMALPLMAMGHLGLSDRLALHAGAGVSPLNSRQEPAADPDGPLPEPIDSHLGVRALAGLQIVLTHAQQANRLILTVEGDAYRASFDDTAYRSFGLVGHLGFFF